MVGRDPLHSAAVWADGWRQNNFIGHKGVAVMGLSAIDGALWDIRGKAAGLNIAALIGQARTGVRAYASGGLWLDRSIDALAGGGRRLRGGRVPRGEDAAGARAPAGHRGAGARGAGGDRARPSS